MARKTLVSLCLMAVAAVSPIGSSDVGVDAALAEECKPIVVCEEIDLIVYSLRICWKVHVTIC